MFCPQGVMENDYNSQYVKKIFSILQNTSRNFSLVMSEIVQYIQYTTQSHH